MNNKQTGMTLLELTVVLFILIALAGLAVPYVAGTNRDSLCQATDTTLQTIKQTIMGGGTKNGYFLDTLGYYPKASRSTTADFDLHYLYDIGGWTSYNPKTGVGWRGPYLAGGRAPHPNIDSSFASLATEIYHPTTNTTGKVHTIIKGSANQQIHDAWGRPIILQVPYSTADTAYELENARLVSAGPGGGIGADEAAIDTSIHDNPNAIDRGDDRVLYLNKPDPFISGNAACSQG